MNDPQKPIGVLLGKLTIRSSDVILGLDRHWTIERFVADAQQADGKTQAVVFRALVCRSRRHAWQQLPLLSNSNRVLCPPCPN